MRFRPQPDSERAISSTGFKRLEPSDWKPMANVGAGCREIRVRDESGAFRVFYVATIGDAVYVLHCFEKKSQRTAKSDLDLGRARYKQMQVLAKETKS